MHPRAIPASHDVATFSDRDARDARPSRRGWRPAMTSIERRGRGRDGGAAPRRSCPRARARRVIRGRRGRRPRPQSRVRVAAPRARLGPLPESLTGFFASRTTADPALPLSLPQVTNGGVACMVQKDKQPEWFPEAKVRPDPSRRFSPARPGHRCHHARRTRRNPKTSNARLVSDGRRLFFLVTGSAATSRIRLAAPRDSNTDEPFPRLTKNLRRFSATASR